MPYITDSGLDFMATVGISINANPSGSDYCRYAAVGTGSLSPSNTTTSLLSQIGNRFNNDGGFTASVAFTAETGYYKKVRTFYRVIDFTADYDLTEWALAPALTGSVAVVDRFRVDPNDTGSATRTISVNNGDQLQLIISEEVHVIDRAGVSTSLDVITDGTPATFDGTYLPFYKTSSSRIQDIFTFFNPQSTTKYCYCINSTGATETAETEAPTALNTSGKTVTGASYVVGTKERTFTASFTTSEVNGDIYGFWFGSNNVSTSSFQGGAKFHFTTTPYFTKLDTQNLYVPISMTWDRA